MSSFARGIMNVGSAISRYSAVIIAVAAAVILAVAALRLSAKGKQLLSGLYRGIFRKLSATMASGRFASAMSLMLSSGVDVDRSLELTYELMDSPVVQDKIISMKASMAEGVRFSDALVQAGLFSGLYARMISVGFKTGTLDSVMKKVAALYEEDLNARIDRLISVLEPLFVAVLSLIVGLILLSVMLPLMGVMTAIG
jgi:type IV pilus assembly protein PilC